MTNSPSRAETIHGIDDVKETINSFLDKIAVAKSLGEQFIETTQEVINHYNRRGMGGSKYFHYEGIRVYPIGMATEIEESFGDVIEHRLHGAP